MGRRGLGLVGIALVAGACTDEIDTTRVVPKRGTLGEELYGVVCDRVGAQALHEDLTGASFIGICHKDETAKYRDKVDQTRLPPAVDGAIDVNGKPVTVE